MLLYLYRFLTPMHVAADKCHYDVMDVLLKHGAKVRMKMGSFFSSTPVVFGHVASLNPSIPHWMCLFERLQMLKLQRTKFSNKPKSLVGKNFIFGRKTRAVFCYVFHQLSA